MSYDQDTEGLVEAIYRLRNAMNGVCNESALVEIVLTDRGWHYANHYLRKLKYFKPYSPIDLPVGDGEIKIFGISVMKKEHK